MSEKNNRPYQQLYQSELITALACSGLIYLMSQSVGLDLRLLLPGGLLIFIILQSAGYWYYRQQLASNPDRRYGWVLPTFSFLKKLNPFLFLTYPLFLMVLLIFFSDKFFSPATIFGIILSAFSILEYFNCYHFSLQRGNFKKPTELNREINNYQRHQ